MDWGNSLLSITDCLDTAVVVVFGTARDYDHTANSHWTFQGVNGVDKASIAYHGDKHQSKSSISSNGVEQFSENVKSSREGGNSVFWHLHPNSSSNPLPAGTVDRCQLTQHLYFHLSWMVFVASRLKKRILVQRK